MKFAENETMHNEHTPEKDRSMKKPTKNNKLIRKQVSKAVIDD